MIADTEKQFRTSELPKEVSQAQVLLQEHNTKKEQIEGMLHASHERGEEIVVRVRQQV